MRDGIYLVNYQHSLTLLLYGSYLCCHSFLGSYVVFFCASESVQLFFIIYFLCIAIGDPVIKRGGLAPH